MSDYDWGLTAYESPCYPCSMSNRNSRKSGKNRRPQTPKVGNEAYMRGMQELRRSSAAGTHSTPKDYRRKPKHAKKGWE